ncbi:Acetoacetyl-CoA synthetase [Smittium culicis]|uniref:Acetoacetyl-CoA synthetase n=1 Tax=Smittium culicis TaxID=133412 RepID=A0A1R1Y0L8_9FUNG|nr:Acetoacetyl-CoA synthetase [Smittium culicis]
MVYEMDISQSPNEIKALWTPSNIEESEFCKFIRQVNSTYNTNINSYWELQKWSTEHIKDFWASVWEYTNIISHSPYKTVVEDQVPMQNIPKWFIGATLNYAENILENMKDSSKVAIYARGEQDHLDISYKQLYSRVCSVATSFKNMGLKKGDRVVAYLTNCSEAIVGMLASASIGAIWSSTSVDFGVTAVIDRFSQIEPKIFIGIDESKYNGKSFSHIEKINQILEKLPTVKNSIIIKTNKTSPSVSELVKNSVTWNSIEDILNPDPVLQYEPVSFDHPLYILFSSGTTGKPKCLVHRTGGILIQHKKEHIITLGMGKDDIYFYYTTTGWMMWNYLVGGLSVGLTIVLFEGSPLGPSPKVLWDLVDELGITVFGTSAKYIQHLEDVNYMPSETHKLDSLKVVLSTASPLKPNSFDFVYEHVKRDVLLGSISGGTDICSLFVGACSILPVYKGEIQAIMLGMAIECWDENGNRVVDQSGDLVCTKPFPCMPIYFWNDDSNNSKYKSAYFSKFPGVWCQGDFMKINTKTNGVFMLGRSDGTLNPNGIRFGSAEIYNVVNRFDEVEDSLVIGQLIDENERVLLFIKTSNRYTGNFEALKSAIVKSIRAELSPRHVPAKIMQIDSIPYTLNGKIVEIAVKLLLNDAYKLACKFSKSNEGKPITREQVVEYVLNNYTLDEKAIQSVSNKNDITQFLKFSDLFFSS